MRDFRKEGESKIYGHELTKNVWLSFLSMNESLVVSLVIMFLFFFKTSAHIVCATAQVL